MLPPLRGRGGDHLGCGFADVWQPHAAQQLLELCRTLLADLVDRGLDPEQAILFVIDGGKAL